MQMRCRHKEFESKSFEIKCEFKEGDICKIDGQACKILSTEVSIDAKSIPAIKRFSRELRNKEA